MYLYFIIKEKTNGVSGVIIYDQWSERCDYICNIYKYNYILQSILTYLCVNCDRNRSSSLYHGIGPTTSRYLGILPAGIRQGSELPTLIPYHWYNIPWPAWSRY